MKEIDIEKKLKSVIFYIVPDSSFLKVSLAK